MEKPFNIRSTGKQIARRGAGVVATAALMMTSLAAFADAPVTMAPPVGQTQDQDYDTSTTNAASASVFNWAEVPQNQQAPIRRAVFDKGGYQLYDDAGETIVVPFTSNNLYVMKFAVSPTNEMYFINEGSAPVLYVPRNGYLENATVPGARWYPFTEQFHPASPVFVGIAPSWDAYIGMGWYNGMSCWGGYWGGRPYYGGGIFIATAGFFIEIGGRPYYGWNHYHDYYYRHPAPYYAGYYHRDVYAWGGRPNWDRHREFNGAGRPFAVGGHGYNGGGGSHTFHGDRTYSNDHAYHGERTVGNDHAFHGDHNTDSSHTFHGDRSVDASHDVHTDRNVDNGHVSGGGHVFQGGRSASGDRPSDAGHTFGGGNSSNGGGRVFNDGHRTFHGSDTGGGSAPATHSDSNSGSRSNSDGRPSYSTGGGGNDHRSNSGGDHASNGGGGDRSSNNGGARSNDSGRDSNNGGGGGNDRGSGGDGGGGRNFGGGFGGSGGGRGDRGRG